MAQAFAGDLVAAPVTLDAINAQINAGLGNMYIVPVHLDISNGSLMIGAGQ
ncbi:hypothetical protein KFU94_41955 [Chloroflexi bacterium TSY]|nr:hypothetical protein [Chloroflexi bacterium TSY]